MNGAAPKAGRKEWIGLGVIAIPSILYSMDLTVLNLALPAMAEDLDPGAAELLWMVDIYGFLLAGFLVTMGTLGDRIGRRKLLLIGATAFGLASLIAAFATSPEMMIAGRAIQGVAAATLAPSTLSLIRNMFLDDRQRSLAIGVWLACFSAGAALGPLVGGLLLTSFWWGSVFLINVPLMLALLAVAPFLLPEFRDPNAGRLDLASAVMSLLAVLAVVFGIKRIAEHGTADGWAIAAGVAGLTVGWLFVRRQKVMPAPLVDIRLFRRAAFAAPLSINVLAIFIFIGVFFFAAQYFQLVLGYSALEAGLWTAPTGIAMVVTSMAAPVLGRSLRPAYGIAGCFGLAALALVLLSQIAIAPFWVTYAGFVILAASAGPIGSFTTDLVISSVPPERAGTASGLSETSFELGGALGIAVLGSVLAAAYRSTALAGIGAAVPPEVADRAGDTLAAASEIAATLPPEVATRLLAVARDAYVAAFAMTSALSAGLAILGMGVALGLMRKVPAPRHRPASATPH